MIEDASLFFVNVFPLQFRRKTPTVVSHMYIYMIQGTNPGSFVVRLRYSGKLSAVLYAPTMRIPILHHIVCDNTHCEKPRFCQVGRVLV